MNPVILSDQQREALRLVIDAILDAIRAAGPHGAPGGVLYAALMGQGCTLAQYDGLMRALIRNGQVRREGDMYFIAERKAA